MQTYRYRAATAAGAVQSGTLEGISRADALDRLRRLGLVPIEAVEAKTAETRAAAGKANTATRRALVNAIGELAMLLDAGLPLERALAITIENAGRPNLKAAFAEIREKVKHGATLARAMAQSPLFPPIAGAMAEAGEASGKLGPNLARLAQALERAETLRQTVVSALIYPALLLTVATGVILVMLLFVVPQFESLFSDLGDKHPFSTQVVLAASAALQNYGWLALVAIAAGVVGLRYWLKQPQVRRAFDRLVLRLPRVGALVAAAETARFARTLGSLVDSGVALPAAMGIAQRSLNNSHMAAAVERVTTGLKQGGGLSRPLAATGVFPPMALSFLRTGEETAQLGPMLIRLADVLDRDVKTAVDRLIAVLTPAITVIMGLIVALVIVSILTALMGFNDLVMQ
jgi:general secretion pathway protein F